LIAHRKSSPRDIAALRAVNMRFGVRFDEDGEPIDGTGVAQASTFYSQALLSGSPVADTSSPEAESSSSEDDLPAQS
jgi:hypothetical protein